MMARRMATVVGVAGWVDVVGWHPQTEERGEEEEGLERRTS